MNPRFTTTLHRKAATVPHKKHTCTSNTSNRRPCSTYCSIAIGTAPLAPTVRHRVKQGIPREQQKLFRIETSEPRSSSLTNFPPFLRLGHHRGCGQLVCHSSSLVGVSGLQGATEVGCTARVAVGSGRQAAEHSAPVSRGIESTSAGWRHRYGPSSAAIIHRRSTCGHAAQGTLASPGDSRRTPR